MSHTRRLSTLLAGLALSVSAFSATAPAAFAIIPGPVHATTVDGKYVPPAPVTHGPGKAQHDGGPGRPARHEARRQPDPAPFLPAGGHTRIMPALV
jgi:hypothetical protein